MPEPVTTSRGWKITRVQSERAKVVAPKLATALGSEAYERLCSLVLDEQKLQTALEDGSVSARVVARATVTTQAKPYIKITGDLV